MEYNDKNGIIPTPSPKTKEEIVQQKSILDVKKKTNTLCGEII